MAEQKEPKLRNIVAYLLVGGAILYAAFGHPFRPEPLSSSSVSPQQYPVQTKDLESQTVETSFEQCLIIREKTITQLNVSPSDIRPLVNTGILTITRICTVDGSVLITCSKEDNKMIIVKSPHGCQ